jgi:hypothetical protein
VCIILFSRKLSDDLIQQKDRPQNSAEWTAPDLRLLLGANLVQILSDIYQNVFGHLRTVGKPVEVCLSSLLKTMLCVFEEHPPGHPRRLFAKMSI